jgi:mono/diheme cytochrome c family protein
MPDPMTPPEARGRAQAREQAEPTERSQPIPLLVAAITLAMVLAGVGYILLSESFGRGAGGGAANGKQLFAANCVACHQATGKGLPGVFPPLDGSEWVTGDERAVANILLHGITGEITVGGNVFKGAMPSFQQLGDAELAAVASYVRSEWSNKAAPIAAGLFAAERKAAIRSTPFSSGDEIKALATTKAP